MHTVIMFPRPGREQQRLSVEPPTWPTSFGTSRSSSSCISCKTSRKYYQDSVLTFLDALKTTNLEMIVLGQGPGEHLQEFLDSVTMEDNTAKY